VTECAQASRKRAADVARANDSYVHLFTPSGFLLLMTKHVTVLMTKLVHSHPFATKLHQKLQIALVIIESGGGNGSNKNYY
jgi:hypothetical protein